MQRIIAGGVVAFVLIVGSDYETTADLSVAFAYLILISAALTVGPIAADRISQLVGVKPTTTVSPRNRPGTLR